VIANVRPPRGEVKRRPAVVVTPTPLIAAATTLQIVGISTSYRPEDPDVVPLGWRSDGRTQTRLRRDSTATATLRDDVPVPDLESTGGHLSKSELLSLLDILRRLAQP
jgi:mRNA-degrading endonuclease toxin of MazEF toxin-antitoxin module